MGVKKKGPYERGSLIALVVLAIVLGVVVYVRHRLSAPFRAIQEAYERTNADYPFDPGPADRLTRARLADYAAVRAAVQPHLEEVVECIRAMREKKRKEGGGVGLALEAAKPLTEISQRVRKAHVEALNARKMSANEYFWIRRRAFAALYRAARTDGADSRKAWDAVTEAFVGGAPRIEKYRDNPPSLIQRLRLQPGRVTDEEMRLVRELHGELFEPVERLYQEVSLVSFGEPQAD